MVFRILEWLKHSRMRMHVWFILWFQSFEYGKHPRSIVNTILLYSLFSIRWFFKGTKVKVKSVKKKHKNVLITYAFVYIRLEKNVCQCIRVYYVLCSHGLLIFLERFYGSLLISARFKICSMNYSRTKPQL